MQIHRGTVVDYTRSFEQNLDGFLVLHFALLLSFGASFFRCKQRTAHIQTKLRLGCRVFAHINNVFTSIARLSLLGRRQEPNSFLIGGLPQI